jgi:hypothetical protein
MNNLNARSFILSSCIPSNSYLEAQPFPEVQAPSFLDPASRVHWYGTSE